MASRFEEGTGAATGPAGATSAAADGRMRRMPARSEETDERLVRAAVAGDTSAFAVLVDRHRTAAVRVAARIAGRETAEDVAQEAFLRAFHRLARFRGDAPFRAWLLRIVHNVAVTVAERNAPAPTGQIEPSEVDRREWALDEPPSRTPADELEASERRERLAAKLELLRPTHRAVLVLRDVEGWSYDDIALITDSPLGSVKGRLFRARRELVELLRANTYDWDLPR